MDVSTEIGAPLIRTSFQLSREQVDWLEAQALRSQSRSMAHVVRVLIATAMNREAEERERSAAAS